MGMFRHRGAKEQYLAVSSKADYWGVPATEEHIRIRPSTNRPGLAAVSDRPIHPITAVVRLGWEYRLADSATIQTRVTLKGTLGPLDNDGRMAARAARVIGDFTPLSHRARGPLETPVDDGPTAQRNAQGKLPMHGSHHGTTAASTPIINRALSGSPKNLRGRSARRADRSTDRMCPPPYSASAAATASSGGRARTIWGACPSSLKPSIGSDPQPPSHRRGWGCHRWG